MAFEFYGKGLTELIQFNYWRNVENLVVAQIANLVQIHRFYLVQQDCIQIYFRVEVVVESLVRKAQVVFN